MNYYISVSEISKHEHQLISGANQIHKQQPAAYRHRPVTTLICSSTNPQTSGTNQNKCLSYSQVLTCINQAPTHGRLQSPIVSSATTEWKHPLPNYIYQLKLEGGSNSLSVLSVATGRKHQLPVFFTSYD